MGFSEIMNRIVGRTFQYHNNFTSGLRKMTGHGEAPRVICQQAPTGPTAEKEAEIPREEKDLSGWKALHVMADEENYPLENIQHQGLREAMMAIHERSTRQFRPASKNSFPELRRIRHSYPLSNTLGVMLGLDPTFKYAIFGRLKDPSETVKVDSSPSDEASDSDISDPDHWVWKIDIDPVLEKVSRVTPKVDPRQIERAICISPAMERAIFGTS